MPNDCPTTSLTRRHAVAVGAAAIAVNDAAAALVHAYPAAPALPRARDALGRAAGRYLASPAEAGVNQAHARETLRGFVRRALTHREGGDVAQALLTDLDAVVGAP
jgi:hypothetical protein